MEEIIHGWDYTIVLLAVLPFVLKVFIIVSLIAGLFISSSVVSTICTEMMTIRSQSNHATNKMKVLRRYLRQVTISPRLSVRMQKQALERLRAQLPLTMDNVRAQDALLVLAHGA